jgi:DNA-3-methyladenine glycosylase II
MNEIRIGIDNLCSYDETLKKIVENVGECKIGKNKQAIFPYLIGLVIGQKIKFSLARKIRGNLYTETGSYNFTINDILKLTEQQWKDISVDDMQKTRILNVTNYFHNNGIDPEKIKKEDILSLKKINGIGDWTTITLLIEYGLDLDLFTTLDKHTNQQLKKYFNVKETKNIVTFSEKWKPYRSIAFWYLWKHELK